MGASSPPSEGASSPPPPSWVKANVEKPPEEERKKREAKFGHALHFRPPPKKVHEACGAGASRPSGGPRPHG